MSTSDPGPYDAGPYAPDSYRPGFYGAGAYGAAAEGGVGRPVNGVAIASMVLGILWILGIGSALAVAMGAQARAQERVAGQRPSPFAVVGIVLGWIGLAATAIVILVLAGNSGTL